MLFAGGKVKPCLVEAFSDITSLTQRNQAPISRITASSTQVLCQCRRCVACKSGAATVSIGEGAKKEAGTKSRVDITTLGGE